MNIYIPRTLETPKRPPEHTCERCGRKVYGLHEWGGVNVCWYPCLMELGYAEEAAEALYDEYHNESSGGY